MLLWILTFEMVQKISLYVVMIKNARCRWTLKLIKFDLKCHFESLLCNFFKYALQLGVIIKAH